MLRAANVSLKSDGDENVSPDTRQNADEECAVTSDNPIGQKELLREICRSRQLECTICPISESAKRNCRGEYVQVDHRNVQCAKDLQAISKCTNRLNHQHILKPFCPSMYNHINKIDTNIYHRSMLEKYNEPWLSKANRTKFECMHFNTNIMDTWGNDVNVHKALHVRKGKFKAWSTCYYNIPYERYVKSVLSYHLHLNNRGYRALIYSGDHDMLQPYLGTLSWIKALNFTVIDNWRPWLVDDQVAGERVIQLQITSRRNASPCSKGGYIMNLYDHFLVTYQDCIYMRATVHMNVVLLLLCN
ncbi:hypothetical protein QYF36_022024 [Acer negundo]|nr:hypothetical protein QYF36_022024 [Acer negundo]